MRKEDLYNSFSEVYPEYLEGLSDDAKSTKSISKKSLAVLLCAVIGIVGSTTIYAAVRYNLGRGMHELQVDENQAQELVEESAAIIYGTEPDYSGLAVTSEGITVVPESVIADERCAFISFKVSGFDFDESVNDPDFDLVDAGEWDYGGGFFDGMIHKGEGLYYEDGTPAEDAIPHYCDSNGDIYYMLCVSEKNIDDNMLGRTISVRFEGLSELNHLEPVNTVNGEWSFTLNLPTHSTSIHKEAGWQIEGTPYYVDSVEISPVSARINYTLHGSGTPNAPHLIGVVLRDGMELRIGDDELSNSVSGHIYQNSYFTQVINPDDVTALQFWPDRSSSTTVTVPVR